MRKKVSIYWKCQLWGWGTYGGLSFIVDYSDSDFKSIFLQSLNLLVLKMSMGILFSHLMRLIINKLRLTEISFWKSIFPLIILTVFFGTCFGIFGLYLKEIITEWKNNSRSENENLVFHFILNGALVLMFWNIIYFFSKSQHRNKKHVQEKTALMIKAIELEAKALRAQMNPHFIFNSLNSIKSLIQQNENEKSVTYLTTFSKLIRTLLNNADKKEISLYDEIETCKLYLQLEAMRFDTKFSYAVNVGKDIDLKSIQVPALIIQPFIENAIWHGIVPRNSTGHVSLNVVRKEGIIEVIIDDDGIGRDASLQNKSGSSLTHQSKGVNLTQTRLELNNLLQQRQSQLEVIDKKDDKGLATGTTVIIKIKEELS